jgi:ATP-dependent Lhr-like helicase
LEIAKTNRARLSCPAMREPDNPSKNRTRFRPSARGIMDYIVMMNPLSLFHPITREWFNRTFPAPTEAQALGWPAIASDRHTLISAPTGSGKTLAAFLLCIDRLLQAAIRGDLADSAQVVYVSPLKALSNDVHRNLSIPLLEITRLAEQKGFKIPEIRVALRTGDTPARERRARARRPPHIWITTPESLYILLTSQSGRLGMSGVHTLILDEIHAIAGNKRGSHLSLSVERLCALAAAPVTRIGLSATMHPIEEVARFLVGSSEHKSGDAPHCNIINAGRLRNVDLQVEMPDMELGPIATLELWEETVSRIAGLVREHRSTLIFVNTRRLVERVAHQLSREIGEENVAAHHGSLSRKTRMKAEERLKHGDVRACVATASLELGIDIGAIDLVCQIGSPRSIGVLLQRAGRSGHYLAGRPKGRIFPLTRDELIECSALLLGVRRGILDKVRIPPWPLDILSQQIVAMCATEEWKVEDLFRLVRKAYPYAGLPRPFFDRIIGMLADGISTRLGRRSAYLHYDRVHRVVRGRRGARLAAITSGGAIPDNADYEVISDPEGTYVGSVYEDFAVESMAGDVFLLGNTSWRIRRIEKGRVRVEDAGGQAPNVPFWQGEAPARTRELSRLVSHVRDEIRQHLADETECLRWLTQEVGLSADAAQQARAYILEGKRILGAVPTDGHVIAERFFDETGGQQLVLHAPFGGRINKAWGLALRGRLRGASDKELQAAATDDGINLSLRPHHSFPLADLPVLLRPTKIEEALTQAVLESPLFVTRWRWTATRSLALLRFAGGRRVPAPLQRMRAEDLMAAIFPAQDGSIGEREEPRAPVPDHPLVFETLRDCLTEAMDVDGLKEVLREIDSGVIQLSGKDTSMASAFAHQILNAMPYAFLDNAPLEERRARAVLLRRALPESAEDLGKLSPDAIRAAADDAWPEVRDAEELHDALLGWVLFPERMLDRLPAEAPGWMDALVQDGRAQRLERNGRGYLAAVEALGTASRAILDESPASPADNPLLPVIRGWMEASGPITANELAEILDFADEDVTDALLYLESEGLLLRGAFSKMEADEFCDRRILARIHRATIAHLRREIEPVPAAAFLRFLFEWQHVAPGTQLAGENGVLEVIDQLQGFETAAAAWEDEILRSRISDYRPDFLDSLCLEGAVVWGRLRRRDTHAEVPMRRPGLTRSAPVGLCMREDLLWLLDQAPADENSLSIIARDVLEFLRRRGASFFAEMVAGTRHLPAEVEEAVWQLVAAGLATADSFTALRSLVSGENKRLERSRRRRQRQRRTREGRWSLLDAAAAVPENKLELQAHQYVRRYGILCRELLAREPSAPPWRTLLGVLRRSEARGELRGGRFLAGLHGEQFALPEAVDALRAQRRKEPSGQYVKIAACDPANLAGILTPGPRIAAVPGNRILHRDGVPVAAVENGQFRLLVPAEPAEQTLMNRLLDIRPASAFDARL